MRSVVIHCILFVFALATPLRARDWNRILRDGDLAFQTSKSGQSRAIQLATHSKYSHVGLVFKRGDGFLVLEAVQPVRYTPFQEWIHRGEGGHFVILRLKEKERTLSSDQMGNMRKVGESFLGRMYDPYFGWGDDRIYCSELVWKVYERGAGIRLTEPRKLGSFDLTSGAVRYKLKERYGNRVPYNEKVVSPEDLFESPLLERVSIQ